VLSTSTVELPTTLPVTGAGSGLVFVIAGGSALAGYLLTKRRFS
jgi:LPXTG-motif cell wall-anchored protein